VLADRPTREQFQGPRVEARLPGVDAADSPVPRSPRKPAPGIVRRMNRMASTPIRRSRATRRAIRLGGPTGESARRSLPTRDQSFRSRTGGRHRPARCASRPPGRSPVAHFEQAAMKRRVRGRDHDPAGPSSRARPRTAFIKVERHRFDAGLENSGAVHRVPTGAPFPDSGVHSMSWR